MTKNIMETTRMRLSIPFALVGGLWLVWLPGYNFSVAVAVGFIALPGVVVETRVVMMAYLAEAWAHLRRNMARPTFDGLCDAVTPDADECVRPKIRTAGAIIAGLLPFLWSHGAGSLPMVRIAAPEEHGPVRKLWMACPHRLP